MRQPMKALVPCAALALLLPASAARAQASATTADAALLARARAILARVPVIDGHNDLPSELLARFGGDPYAAHLDTGQPALMTDIPRLRKGHVGAQFWSAYVANDSIRTGAALRQALREVDMARRLTAAYPAALAPATSAADIERIEASGRTASLIGVEGGHAIENSLSALRMLYALGVRYMTLTHNTTLDWADAAMDYPRHHGLTPFGVAVVHEMNRLGMFVDIAHVSADVMRDVLRYSRAPVIFSHSSARALVDVPRNAPDDVLRMLASNGGVIMVNFCPCFTARGIDRWNARRDSVRAAAKAGTATLEEADARLRQWVSDNPAPQATVSDIADHIDHIRKVAGIDYIGVGSDFDGIGSGPVGLEDVSTFPALFAELLRRGYSEADIEKIAGRNLLRAMKRMEAVAADLQQRERPSLVDIAPPVRP